MSIEYITIPVGILQLPISDKQKMLLGLICAFGDRGLMMSNSELGKLLSIHFNTVGVLIGQLKAKNLIRINNNQSKYRKIYFNENSGVESNLLIANRISTHLKNKPTHLKTDSYSSENIEHNISNLKENNININKNSFSYQPRYKSFAQEQEEIHAYNLKLIREHRERNNNG
jgi:hypothetical protein